MKIQIIQIFTGRLTVGCPTTRLRLLCWQRDYLENGRKTLVRQHSQVTGNFQSDSSGTTVDEVTNCAGAQDTFFQMFLIAPTHSFTSFSQLSVAVEHCERFLINSDRPLLCSDSSLLLGYETSSLFSSPLVPVQTCPPKTAPNNTL